MVKNEMIERGALAIKAIDDRNNARDHSSTYSTPESIAEDNRAKARAVIEAMREPTEAMVEAGEKDGGNSFYRWPKMIDAALSEEGA